MIHIKRKKINKWAIFSLFFCIIIIASTIGIKSVTAFTQPTTAPPGINTPEFLRIGDINQAKRGALRLGNDDIISPFNYQLEVLGIGADISNVIADNNLQISESSSSLFVDSENNRVCIGTCLGITNSKLEVDDRMQVTGTSSSGVQAVSSDSEAIYGTGDTYGIQGVAANINSYGIWAVNTLGTALEGSNTASPAQYSSIAGFSDTGYAIYGSNTNPTGLWSGYFQGRLGSNADISGAKFVATGLQDSLIPYTSGQELTSFDFGNSRIEHFDGTHLWLVQNDNLLKVRASDGFKLFEVTVGANITDVISSSDAVWVTVAGTNEVKKINLLSGDTECTLAVTNPQGIAFQGQFVLDSSNISQYYWVTASGAGGEGELVKVHYDVDQNTCEILGSPISLTTSDYTLSKIIFNGSYLWVLANETATNSGSVVNVNPSNGEAVRWDSLISSNPQDIFFDNHFYWVTNKDVNSLTQFFLSDSKVCSQDVQTSCTNDADCTGLGACFALPQNFNTYATGNKPTSLAYDGTYIWVANELDQTLSRLLIADPSQRRDFSLGSYKATGLLFDGTNLWSSLADSGLGSYKLAKYYSGTGYGSTDLNGILALQNNSALLAQNGGFSVSGSGIIGDDASDILTAEGDLVSSNNVWGGTIDTIIPLTQGGSANCSGTANCFNCPNGYFVKNIKMLNPVEFGTGGIIIGNDQRAEDVAIDSQYMYIVGEDNSGNWRVEKRRLSDGALCTGGVCAPDPDFGTGGSVTSAENIKFIVIDDTYMYLSGQTSGLEPYTEKRLLSNGSLEAAYGAGFGTSGYTVSPTGLFNQQAALDSASLYVIGGDPWPDYGIRVEKRDSVTGALDPVFGGGTGVIVSPNTKSGKRIAVDNNYMYLAGYVEIANAGGGVDNLWQIEKRDLVNGDLETGFSGDGIITGTIDDLPAIQEQGEPFTVVIDDDYVYVAGMYWSVDNYVWRIEKYHINTGAPVAAFGNNGVVLGVSGSDWVEEMKIDTDYMYLIGADNRQGWRWEKRRLDTGALCTAAECGIGFGYDSGGTYTGDGVVSGPVNPGDDYAQAIAIDSDYMYGVGFEPGELWRIEKRFQSTGALVDGTNNDNQLQCRPL